MNKLKNLFFQHPRRQSTYPVKNSSSFHHSYDKFFLKLFSPRLFRFSWKLIQALRKLIPLADRILVQRILPQTQVSCSDGWTYFRASPMAWNS